MYSNGKGKEGLSELESIVEMRCKFCVKLIPKLAMLALSVHYEIEI